jgi:hypothetical protein
VIPTASTTTGTQNWLSVRMALAVDLFIRVIRAAPASIRRAVPAPCREQDDNAIRRNRNTFQSREDLSLASQFQVAPRTVAGRRLAVVVVRASCLLGKALRRHAGSLHHNLQRTRFRAEVLARAFKVCAGQTAHGLRPAGGAPALFQPVCDLWQLPAADVDLRLPGGDTPWSQTATPGIVIPAKAGIHEFSHKLFRVVASWRHDPIRRFAPTR